MKLILNQLFDKADKVSCAILMINILLKMLLPFWQKSIKNKKIFALIY